MKTTKQVFNLWCECYFHLCISEHFSKVLWSNIISNKLYHIYYIPKYTSQNHHEVTDITHWKWLTFMVFLSIQGVYYINLGCFITTCTSLNKYNFKGKIVISAQVWVQRFEERRQIFVSPFISWKTVLAINHSRLINSSLKSSHRHISDRFRVHFCFR